MGIVPELEISAVTTVAENGLSEPVTPDTINGDAEGTVLGTVPLVYLPIRTICSALTKFASSDESTFPAVNAFFA